MNPVLLTTPSENFEFTTGQGTNSRTASNKLRSSSLETPSFSNIPGTGSDSQEVAFEILLFCCFIELTGVSATCGEPALDFD